MKLLRRLQLGLIGGSVLLPLATVASCTINETNLSPDAGIGNGIDAGTLGSSEAGSEDAGRADGVIREVALHQVTVLPEHAPATVPAFSRDGKRIVFSTRGDSTPAHPNKIYVVDADGANVKEVDSYVPSCGCNSIVAISDDGSTVVSSAAEEVRIVAVAGGLKNELKLDNNVVSDLALNAGGTEAYLLTARNAQVLPANTAFERGFYKMPATSGAAPTQVLGPAKVAALIGGIVADDVFPFAACGGGLAVSSDGAKAVVAVQVKDHQVILSTDGATPKLVMSLTEGGKLVIHTGISSDGSTIAYYVNASNTQGAEVGTISPDGANRKKLFEASSSDACSAPLTLSNDNKNLALGRYGMVFPTDGAEPWTVLGQTGASPNGFFFLGEPDGSNSRDMSMSGDGKRFAFLNADANDPANHGRHVGIAELDVSALGPVPTVSAPHASRASIPRDGTTFAILSAKAPVGAFVGSQMFLAGDLDRSGGLGQVLLLDDGKNNDTAAGDGTYASGNNVYALPAATAGKRVLRIKAETKDNATGKRAAHFVDFGPFAVE